ncbi:MAG TPA: hypothetical protein VFZ67_04555 [Nitrososphaera sp.]
MAQLEEEERTGELILIKDPISGVAIISEIFQASKKNEILHPSYQDMTAEDNARSASTPEEREYLLHNWSTSFSNVANCDHQDCPLCLRGDGITILEEPMLVTIGKSLYAPEVQAATKRFRLARRRRKKHLQLMKLAMQSILISNSTFDALDAIDEKDE